VDKQIVAPARALRIADARSVPIVIVHFAGVGITVPGTVEQRDVDTVRVRRLELFPAAS
jgi:hypothetical protein